MEMQYAARTHLVAAHTWLRVVGVCESHEYLRTPTRTQEVAMEIEAARLLVYNAARRKEPVDDFFTSTRFRTKLALA